MFKRLFLATAVLVAAVALFVGFTLPSPRLQLAPFGDGTVAGLIHIHTNRSDGLSGPDDIAAAAAKAGLRFIVFTDHGDGTRAPDPPVYRSGVLCLDGVEISTNQGHYVAIGMPAAQYPLAGDARDVVEDVTRLGGFGIAAHPDSPNPKLAWREWDAPFDGIELLNPDTSWRALVAEPGFDSKRRIVTALVDYPFRPTETMARHLRDSLSVASWQALSARRRVVAIGGVDAHAKVQWGSGGDAYALPFFGYESAFRLMSVHVSTGSPLTGEAASDADLIIRGICAGHLYTAVDGLATPPAFEFFAANATDTVYEGDEVPAGGGLALRIRSNAPPAYTTIVHKGTTVLATAKDAGDWTVHANGEPGVFWAEIMAPHDPQPIPWVRSNPIYVRSPAPPAEEAPPPEVELVRSLVNGSTLDGWHVEQDTGSHGEAGIAAGPSDPQLSFQFSLADGPPATQMASLVYVTAEGVQDADRIAFTVRAERPMRVSVQLRSKKADRWQRSIYVDTTSVEKTIRFDDMTAIGRTSTPAPPLADIQSIMFVVDLTNNRPGSSGNLWLSNLRLERRAQP